MKDMKTYRYIVLGLFAALAAFSCAKEEKTDYLTLGQTSYVFSKGEDTVTIAVNCSGEWNVDNTNDWLAYEKVTEDSLTIIAAANAGNEERSGVLSVVSAAGLKVDFSVSQFGLTYSGRLEDFTEYWDAKISRDGHYFVVMHKCEDNVKLLYPTLIDTYTGERTEFKDVKDYSSVVAVANDGSIFLYESGGESKMAVLNNGEINDVQVPEGFRSPKIEAVSGDGSIWVGYVSRNGKSGYVPARWVNGEFEELEAPEHNLYGGETSGTMARGCSADGSVIYGSEWSWMQHPVVYWKDGEMYYPGYEYSEMKGDYVAAMVLNAENTNISDDGRYITSTYNDSVDGDRVAVVDTQTGQMFVLDNTEGLGGLHVTNDGKIFAAPSGGGYSCSVVDLNEGGVVSLSDWFMANYNLNISDNRIVRHVADNGNIFFGFKIVNSGSGAMAKYWYLVVDKNKYIE